MIAFALLAASGLLIRPTQLALGGAPRATVAASARELGYQNEAAGASQFVRQMQFSDEVMLLRVAARRCAEEKDLESQRTLMLQCAKVQDSLRKQLAALEESQADLKGLARAVDGVLSAGDKVFSSDFGSTLTELQRELD